MHEILFSLHSFSGRLIHNWSPLAKNCVLGTSRHGVHKNLSESTWLASIRKISMDQSHHQMWDRASECTMPRPQVIHCASPGFRIPTFPAVSSTRRKKRLLKKRTEHHHTGNLTGNNSVFLCFLTTECYNIANRSFVNGQVDGPKKSSWLRSPGESGSK